MTVFFSILLLLAPCIYFVKFMHLPLMHIEFLYFLLTVLAGGILIAATLWRATWVRLTLLLPLWVVFSVSFLPQFQSLWALKFTWLTLVIATLLLGQNILSVLVCVLSIFCCALFFYPVGQQFEKITVSKQATSSKQNLPPIIDIIFDEHAGINNLAAQPNQEIALKNMIKQFYLNYGFTLYTHAYSRYSRTYDAIPNLLNFTASPQDDFYFKQKSQQILEENKTFNLLSQQGYKLRIYQSNYINFCRTSHVNYSYCYTYPDFSFAYFYQVPMNHYQRYAFILKSYLYTSGLFQELMYGYSYFLQPAAAAIHLPLPNWRWNQNEMSTLMALFPISQLQNDVLQHAHDGSAFFAHILIPHSPYIYNAKCEPNFYPMTWLINYDYGPLGNTTTRRALRYKLYDQQMFCLYKQLKPMFDAWQQAGILKTAIIVIQGDHGARLPEIDPIIENKTKIRQQDKLDAYPTLFAIKEPKQSAGVDDQWLPITYLFGKTMRQITQQNFVIDNEDPYVFLTDAEPHTGMIQPKVTILPT